MSTYRKDDFKTMKLLKSDLVQMIIGFILLLIVIIFLMSYYSYSTNAANESLVKNETRYGNDETTSVTTSEPNNETTEEVSSVTMMASENELNDALTLIKTQEESSSFNEKCLKSKYLIETNTKPVDIKKEKGYVNVGILNVRTEPSTKSKKIGELYYGTLKTYYDFGDDKFVKICYKKKDAYVSKDYLQKKNPMKNGIKKMAYRADKAGRKSLEDYHNITAVSSAQYKLQTCSETDSKTGLRKINGRYMIAVGSYYSHNIGQYVDVVLENGTIIPCVIGDAKQDIHTTDGCSIGLDGGAVEFISDFHQIPKICYQWGSMSYNPYEDWYSSVKYLVIYDIDLI
jgi:hypothetical protein